MPSQHVQELLSSPEQEFPHWQDFTAKHFKFLPLRHEAYSSSLSISGAGAACCWSCMLVSSTLQRGALPFWQEHSWQLRGMLLVHCEERRKVVMNSMSACRVNPELHQQTAVGCSPAFWTLRPSRESGRLLMSSSGSPESGVMSPKMLEAAGAPTMTSDLLLSLQMAQPSQTSAAGRLR